MVIKYPLIKLKRDQIKNEQVSVLAIVWSAGRKSEFVLWMTANSCSTVSCLNRPTDLRRTFLHASTGPEQG